MTQSNIYDLHDKAFSRVSAFVVARDGEKVATIAFKFPADGAGRLYAYVHWLGEPMVRAYASGYGYDKRSAAASAAATRLSKPPAAWSPMDGQVIETDAKVIRAWQSFRDVLTPDDGSTWDRRLQDAGFTVWQAV